MKNLAVGALGGALSLAGAAGYNAMKGPSSAPTPNNEPVPKVAKVDPSGGGVHKSTVTPDYRASKTASKTIGNMSMSVDRPSENTWVFTFKGASTGEAVKQAKQTVQEELGRMRGDPSGRGISADFEEGDDGTIIVTVNKASESQLRGVRQAMGEAVNHGKWRRS